MKKLYTTLFAAFFAAALNAAPVVLVMDMQKAHMNYYKAKEAQQQLQASAQATKDELGKMDVKRQALIKDLKAVEEKLQNKALTDDAKKKIVEEAQPKMTELRQLEQNMQQMSQSTQQRLNQNAQQIGMQHRKEIMEVVNKVAAAKKADFVLEKNALYFSKPSADITDEVIAEINKNAPADVPAVPAKK